MTVVRELKRRNVFRVAIAYLVTSWLLLQVSDTLVPALHLPEWFHSGVAFLLVVGFPLALIFAWAFELTPEGLKKEKDVDRSQSNTHQTGRKLDFVIIGLLAVALAFFIWDKFFLSVARDAALVEATKQAVTKRINADPEISAESDMSIAVLPFVNMSGDPENEYFSDGLSDELLNTLVRTGGLKVTGRTSSFAFRGQNKDLREIGRLLSVANVLEGSVRKDGNRVRITAQLVKTSDGYHLWSETFDRELDDIFAIQAEIANQVTRALHGALLGQDEADLRVAALPSQNPQAYEEYLRGMYVLQHNLDDAEALEQARERFAQALEIDGQYLEGHWGMFKSWDRSHRNGHGSYEHSAERLAFYAAELERLAPGSEQSLTSNARSAIVHRDFMRSAELLGEALRRFPESSRILGRFGNQALMLGGYEKGVEATRAALRLDPLSPEYIVTMAALQHRLGNCDGLQETLERALELDTAMGRVRYHLAMCKYEFKGDVTQAVQIANNEPLRFMHHTSLAIFLHRLGELEVAQQHLDKLIELYGDRAAYQYGQIYAQWGETDRALAWLETAVQIRDPGALLTRGDGLLNPLRDEPRFQQILESVGFR